MQADREHGGQDGRHVRIRSDSDIVHARQRARSLARQLGFRSSEATLISLAISELARNMLRYAQEGEIILTPLNRREVNGIEVVARDRGPGIPDLSLAMQDGFSTSGGLGLGLPGVKRLMDEFEINSKLGHGTIVIAKKWKQ